MNGSGQGGSSLPISPATATGETEQGKLSPTMSMSSLEIMMRRLMQEQEDRMKTHTSEVCVRTSTSHVTLLKQEIVLERNECVRESQHVVSELKEIREEV